MRAFSRRTATSFIFGLIAAGASGRAIAEKQRRELIIWGPPAGPSITLVHAINSGMLQFLADRITFKSWRNPDELRAGLTSKTMDVFVLPTQTAANLYNRGLGVRLVNVMTNGLLYVVSANKDIASVTDLKGKTIAVPFRNDTPDILFNQLLRLNQMSPEKDLALQFTGTPIEAIQLLAAGRIDAALVPEPAASAAIVRTGLSGKAVSRVINVQEAWAAATGAPPILPQAGLGVSTGFLNENGPSIPRLQEALMEATAMVNANPARAASHAASVLEMPWPVLEKSIPYSNLVATPAREARASLEEMFNVIAKENPKIVGGALPSAEFYV